MMTRCTITPSLWALFFASALGACVRSPEPQTVQSIQSTTQRTPDAVADASRPAPAYTGEIPRTDRIQVVPESPRRNDSRNPIFPAQLIRLQDDGLARTVTLGGQPHVPQVAGGGAPPAPGPNPQRLLHFVHLADTQLPDDESPGRMAKLDGLGDTNGAFRPQEGYACRIISAAVRTINAIHRQDPVAFVLLGGDNADNAQENEIDWVLKLLGSKAETLHCDSGDDDDLEQGPGNDPKDPFMTEGLLVPFKWVNGNHDILVQGNFAIDELFQQLTTGSDPRLGTRDYRLFGGPVVTTPVVADPQRVFLSRQEIMRRVATHEDGHGVGAAQMAHGKAFYSFDVPGTELRFIVLDTAAETGGSEGVLHKADIDALLIPMLDAARAEGKLVILNGHHSTAALTLDGGVFGVKQDDALTQTQWLELLDAYPEIMFSVVAHSHTHRVRELALPSGRHIFEIMTASLLDFPGQFRDIEIFDENNGYLRMHATCVDYATDDRLALEARDLMFVDWASGWGLNGEAPDHFKNVDLWVKKP